MCIYGGLAYRLWPQLQTPFSNPQLNPQQATYNTATSKASVGVEWVFEDIANFFKLLDFKKNLELRLSSIGKIYIVCAFLRNIHTCVYGTMTSTLFQHVTSLIFSSNFLIIAIVNCCYCIICCWNKFRCCCCSCLSCRRANSCFLNSSLFCLR